MIRTPICDLLNIKHPIALGGMGSASAPAMTAAVSRAGGLGALGCHYLTPEQIRERTAATRKETNKPFGLNFLLFDTREDSFATALELRPPVIQFAWARADQDLKQFFDRAHEAGCKVTYMAGAVNEAVRAAKAGADVIITQDTEGGGHVGWMGSMPQSRVESIARLRAARESGDTDEGPLSMGQDAGLIRNIPHAAEIVIPDCRRSRGDLDLQAASPRGRRANGHV
jgi:NAD(P)H-dependent flavin oxidoreductase YrpB (nitropropane dioxygenase family)